MSKISLLDCTLRDGGYINNWQFGNKEIKKISRRLVKAGIDIIEMGFLTDLPHTKNDSLFGNCEEIDLACPDKGDSLLAAMIALGEKEINPASLPSKADCGLDIVRITFHKSDVEINRAISYAKCLMEKGYKVCMQPVGTIAYSDYDLLALIEKINNLSPFAFYLVDTLGSLYNADLLRLIYLADNNLSPSIKLGFHSHNNLQMAFSNAQRIIEHYSDREFIIDCSLYGMGRGAGNLCTELIAKYTNNIGLSSYDIASILDAIDNYIYPIFVKNSWGYNAHYYMAAIHKCHPNYASYLMNKQTLTMNTVNLLLQNLPKDKRHIFDKSLIEQLYLNMQSNIINDDATRDYIAKSIEGRDVLILAPGASAEQCKNEINRFIETKNPIVISVNIDFESYNEDFIFISNNKRMLSFDYDKYNGKIIVTSNLSALNNDFLKVDYKRLCDNDYSEPDNAGMMLLRLLSSLGLEKAYLAGFDGFSSNNKSNYFTDKMVSLVDDNEAYNKNLCICKQLKKIKQDMDIEFITPSIYDRMMRNEEL